MATFERIKRWLRKPLRRNRKKKSSYDSHFNAPIKFSGTDWYINERIVEIAFAIRHISFQEQGNRVLEFGCTRSDLALQLASCGFDVVGVDLRAYPFTHPNLSFYQKNLLNFTDTEGFDYITAISVLEHIGLGAYGETQNRDDLTSVVHKLSQLLRPNGKLLVTVPFGQPHEDSFLRSFSYSQVNQLFLPTGLVLVDEKYFGRYDWKFWQPISRDKTLSFSNRKPDRGPTGTNCIACFAWQEE
jgi:SAM-dependent methyltransferase